MLRDSPSLARALDKKERAVPPLILLPPEIQYLLTVNIAIR
jgi:hypothetical protein